MMGGKREEAALIYERQLQDAVLAEEEQLYKVPENWCWTRLGSITKIVSGGTPPSRVSEYYADGTIPWISPADLSGYTDIYISKGAKSITESGLEKSSARMVPAGTVCLSSRAPIGYVAIARNPLCTNQGFKNFLPSSCYLPQYLYWYLKGNKALLESHASGTTFLELSAGKAGLIEFPLAPLSEQRRIVERIESLFARLDGAKEAAWAALNSLESDKAAVFYKAFTGGLTAQWRREQGVGMESWEKTVLKDVCEVNPGRRDTRGLPDDLEVSFFPMSSLSEVYGEITKPQIRLLKDVRTGFTNFSEGDVVFAKITPCMENGKSAVIGRLVNGIGYGTTEFYVLRCGARLYNRYLYYIVRDDLFRKKAKAVMTGAVGQQRVPKSFMEDYVLTLPSIAEQIEIVRILDDIFTGEQQVKEAVDRVLEQIDTVKKIILARAFSGGLGTNHPDDESAVELIKQVLTEAASVEDGRSKPRKRMVKKEEVIRMPKTIPEILSEGERMVPEILKDRTGLKIDDFYEQLKELIDKGKVIEIRIGGESYLEAADADRQTGNR